VMPIQATLVMEDAQLDLGRGLAPLNLEPMTRFRHVGGSVSRVDDLLAPEASRRVVLSKDAKLLAATRDLRHVVAADGDDLILIGDHVRRLRSGRADSATFLPGGRLLVTAASVQTATWHGRTYEQRGIHRVLLLDLAGEMLDEREVPEVVDAGAFASAHPADGSMIVEFGMGQDGSEIYRIDVGGDQIALDHVLQNVVACGFSPDGERLLVLPHPSFPSNPSALRWPGLARCGEVTSSSTITSEGAAYDHYGCYLASDRVLLKTVEHGLVLGNRDLDQLVPIELPGIPPIGETFDIGLILGINRRRFAAALWDDGYNRTTVWTLPD